MADEDSICGSFMTGFLFGNIDQKGNLEDDFLDDESKKHLGALAILGGDMNVKSLLTDDGGPQDDDSDDDSKPEKTASAIDYSDINELIEDEEGVEPMQQVPSPTSYPMDPPPVPSSASGNESDPNGDRITNKHLFAPLADMLPPEFKGVDVREFFPDFKVGEVLRFSRLFPPQYLLSLYKKKKKGEDSANQKPAGNRRDADIMNWGAEPTAEQLMKDQHVTFLEPLKDAKQKSHAPKSGNKESKTTNEVLSNAWRHGPAQYWFDMLDVDPDAKTFDYGFKKKEVSDEKHDTKDQKLLPQEQLSDAEGNNESEIMDTDVVPVVASDDKIEYPEDAYLMVSQAQWEDDIVWSGDDSRAAILASQKTKAPTSGWLPTPQCRTVEQYAQVHKIPYFFDQSAKHFQSFFPIENDDLVYSAWEMEIIWDPENMEVIPKPRGLTLDLNDENIVYEIPEDKQPEVLDKDQQSSNVKKEPRKSQLALQKIGIVKEKEEEEEVPVNQRKDPFNISNDEYYNPKVANDTALRTNVGGSLIQHSTPAVDLRQPFFPTFLGVTKLRQFHRPPLKRYSHGTMATAGPIPVQGLLKQIKRKAKLRDQERIAMGGGEIFFMRTPQDLTACDGELILVEYSEEFPSILMQPGMATKIKNFYKRKPGGDNKPPDFKFGELALAHHSPFLGNMHPGQTIQALENNMYRAPIYAHLVPETDFLVIRNRQHYYIRRVTDLFCVGQLCPLMEVPGPNSKRANIFIRDFLQAFIYRLFWASPDTPKRIKMEDIKKAFQSHSESSIRKRLKLCADFKRTGADSNWWVIKPDFRLPTHEEIRAMVSPEQCCAFYSMIAAEQRLKDAGYGEKSLFAPEHDEDDEAKIEDEVKTAPWNTTRAYIQALKGKCLLQLTGDADPTGCGEGFAYVRVPNKPVVNKGDQKADTPKKTVTGTNADLRRLNLADAKKLLRDKGVPESEIKKLSRWEVIDVVRTMSTHEAKAGEEGDTIKFARGNRFSVAEHQERYREECQRLFDLQNKILASDEILSTDEEGSDSNSEDSDYEQMGKNIESMLTNKKSSSELSKEREEAELKQLQRSLMGKGSKDKNASSQDLLSENKSMVRKLVITRTFKDANEGHLYTRMEVVTKPLVIEAYLKIRKTKQPEFIKQFASLDENQKEEMKRERRRIQEQLRRIKRNEAKLAAKAENEKDGGSGSKKKKKENLKEIKLKCGACGQVGHMRTNKECPLYAGGGGGIGMGPGTKSGSQSSQHVALTEEEEENVEKSVIPADENLIHVEGTKVVLSKQLLEHADNIKKKTLTLKFPKNMPSKDKESKNAKGKRRKAGTAVHCDYLTRPNKVAHRRRADPLVSLCSIFESIINDMKDIPNSAPFHVPVNVKVVPDYLKIVSKPMDLQTLKANVRERKYENREQFLTDVHQILENSKLYNGPKSVYTHTAQSMLELTLRRFAEKEDKLMRLEKAINPLLDDDDQVSFSFILENVIENHLKVIENVWPFLNPVNRKLVKDYYDVITQPMDLSTLLENVKKHKYHDRDSFLHDVELIYKNCVRYNGEKSGFSETALKILNLAQTCLSENEEQLQELEMGIRQKQEAAMEGLESESIMTGTSLRDDLSNLDDDTRGDYTIVEGGENSLLDNSNSMMIESQTIPGTSQEEGEDYVDIMDEEEAAAAQSHDQNYDMTYYYQQEATNQDSTLGMDLQLSGDEDDGIDEQQDEASSRFSEQPAADEDSQMSFNAEMFFQTNFNTTGKFPPPPDDENAQDGQDMMMVPDVVHNDLRLSDSEDDDEDEEMPAEGAGFDFDEFDD